MGVPFYNVDPNKNKQSASEATGTNQQTSGESSIVSGVNPGGGSGQGGATGGQMPFTNIQTYLSANPQGGGGDKILQESVGKDVQSITSDAQKSYDNFNKNISDANSGYLDVKSLDKAARSAYGEEVGSQVDPNKTLGGGPSQFNALNYQLERYNNAQSPQLQNYYKPTNKLADYSNKLGNEDSFKQTMQGLYSKYASDKGTNMGSGVKALQEQLDFGGSSSLKNKRDAIVSDANNARNMIEGYNRAAEPRFAETKNKIEQSKKDASELLSKLTSDRQGFDRELEDASYTDESGRHSLKDRLKKYGGDNSWYNNNGSNFMEARKQEYQKIYNDLLKKYGFGG